MKTLSNAGNSQYPEIPECENAQVETISRVDLAWLAGIIDGEGCLSMAWFKQKKCPSGNYIKAEIIIANIDARLIARVSEILYKMNVPFHYVLQKKKKPRKPALQITSSGFRTCKKILDILMPYLVSKKDQAELMVEYLNKRISVFEATKKERRAKNGWFAKSDKMQYGELDRFYESRLKELKTPPIDPQRLQRRASRPLQLG